MAQTLMQTIPFVQATHNLGKQRVKAVVIRLSNTTSDSGSALAIASMWSKPNSPLDSCHYVLDEEHTYQCVPDNKVSYATQFDKGFVSINVCAQPVFDTRFWNDPDYSRMFSRAAKLTAELCAVHKIPVRDTNLLEIRKFFARGGIMINVQGSWPEEDFLNLVNYYMLQGGA